MACGNRFVNNFALPISADDDIKWLIVYVLLSRVRASLACAAHKSTFMPHDERAGPSTAVLDSATNMRRQPRRKTKAAAKQALRRTSDDPTSAG